jgi:elongation factor P--(R)-beta-lysine ligase
MSVESDSLQSRLRRRAEALSSARSFFTKRGLIEVDPIVLCSSASIDVNIDLFVTPSPIHGKRFLFSSPEYAMKRLLSDGSGDIFYLGHVWRHEDAGQRHSPEFLMAEWYRLGMTFDQIMEETAQFAELFIGKRPHRFLPYREAFQTYASIDPFTASQEQLVEACRSFQGYPIEQSSRDELLNLLLAMYVEPRMNPKEITALYHYPASQAALARHVTVDGFSVAERFELYSEGIELANGYHELSDGTEQRGRFVTDNAERVRLGKDPYPIDERFLCALQKGLPDCSGVAVGVDRLLMIREGTSAIADVMPIGWTES